MTLAPKVATNRAAVVAATPQTRLLTTPRRCRDATARSVLLLAPGSPQWSARESERLITRRSCGTSPAVPSAPRRLASARTLVGSTVFDPALAAVEPLLSPTGQRYDGHERSAPQPI
jgi:hypothetical protein